MFQNILFHPGDASLVRTRRSHMGALALCGVLLTHGVCATDAGASPQAMPHYGLLEQALTRYRQLAAQPDLWQLPALPRRSLRPGDQYEGVATLHRLLVTLGDLPTDTPASAQSVLDPALVTGLKHFQQRHGLAADGVLGPATWRALTTPLSRRLRQIEWTLARWRELPANPWQRAIFINIPRFRLYGLSAMNDRESQMLQIDVVVGSAIEALRTPTLVADLTHLVFHPYWDVPRSITLKELLPAARADDGYFARHHYELVDRSGRVVPYAPELLETLASGQLRLRQQPGADNALGAVKFLMPNPHDVYLHDTPERALFSRATRAYSHGCIRVADPAALARFALQDDPAWTPERIAGALQGTTTLRVELPEPIRVYLVYGTAMAREDGSVLFLDDLYGLEQD